MKRVYKKLFILLIAGMLCVSMMQAAFFRKAFNYVVDNTGLSYLTKDNFRVVVDGGCYRSRQIKDANRLRGYIDTYGLAVIVNLQEKGENQEYVAQEQAIAKEKGVKHVSIHLDANKYPTPTQMEQVIKLINLAINNKINPK